MPMITVRLKNAGDKLPMPGRPGSLAPADPFEVDEMDPFWAACLRDGSIVPAESAPAPAGSTKKTVKE